MGEKAIKQATSATPASQIDVGGYQRTLTRVEAEVGANVFSKVASSAGESCSGAAAGSSSN